MHGKNIVDRTVQIELEESLEEFPVVALLGPRQCGKSTLAKRLLSLKPNTVYLDLESPRDLAKLQEPELFFLQHQGELICLDEIQRLPEVFPVIRSIVDRNRSNAQFLILGSASRELIAQSSESLAGRVAYIELAPLSYDEINRDKSNSISLEQFWFRGGFPDSLLARSDKASIRWRENFIRTFLEKDIPQLGFRIPASTLHRFWQMCAHSQGQILNSSKLGGALGVSHTTLRSYVDLLEETFMLRILQPYTPNLKKRLVKSPKVYIRDSGILHTLLSIDSYDEMMGHPVFGVSWESMAIETIIARHPDWEPFFYRTATGTEIDLVLVRGDKKIAFEFKASTAPKLSKGFWNALDDLGIDQAWVVAPVDSPYPLDKIVSVTGL